MKPVGIMLNFFRKKTVKRGEGRSDEPPIMMTSSDERGVSRHRQGKSHSVVFERELTDAGGLRFRSMHSSCSSSLDEVRFLPSQASSPSRGVYAKNQRKMSFTSSALDSSSSYSDYENGFVLRPLNEQPTQIIHSSPRASPHQRLSSAHRSSGHSRSLTAIADPASRAAERKGVLDYLRSSVEMTPRLYRKNPQQKSLPFHAPSTDAEDDQLLGRCPSAAAAAAQGSRGSEWSFRGHVVGDASPVPPPRKKRPSRGPGRDVESDRSSLTSSSTEAAAASDARPSMKTAAAFSSTGAETEFTGADSSNIDSPEFRCNLPNDFSDLGLDILNISSAVLSPPNEKSSFDLLQEIDKKRGDAACDLASPMMTPESSDLIRSGDVSRIEPSTCRILDSDSFLFNSECSTSSVCDSSFESLFQNESAEFSTRPKFQSEAIAKSIFSKYQKQEFSDGCLSLKYGEDEEDDLSGNGDHSFDLKSQLSAAFAARAPEVLRNFRRASENRSVHENSAEDGGPSLAPNSDWNSSSESFHRGDLLAANSVRALQPDVLIGTQQNPTTCYVSSLADDSLDPVNDRMHSTVKPFARDLSIGHQLHGFPSKTLVTINEKSTIREVIEKILTLEKISDDWFLYALLLISPQEPTNGIDGAVELDVDDFPVRYLDEGNRHRGSVWFELRRTEGIRIRVSCHASFERPKTVHFEISRRLICRFVVEAAVEKFELRSAAKFCLIELDRSRKELVMRRINESEVVAQLNSGQFLLCEKEFIFESRRKVNQLPLVSPSITSLSSRLSCSSTRNTFTPEVDALKNVVKQLEAKLVDNERHFLQKLTRHQSQLGRYRSIALCTAPNERLLLLEEEFRRLTEEIQDQERQIKTQGDICRISSDSKKERDRMLSMENAFIKLNNERQEVCDCLLKERQQPQTNGRRRRLNHSIAPPVDCLWK